MKVNRILPVIVSLVMAGGVLAGCAHKHTYEEKWTPAEDGSGHYHVATCHPDEHDELKDHVYDDDKDTTCNDCGYVRTVEQGTPDPDPKPTPDPDPEPSGETSTPLPAGKKIYLVGDSTVCDYVKDSGEHTDKNTYYVVRYGYGTQLTEYLNVTSNQVVNLALSGRSSLSYLAEANYTTLKNSIADGDYLIIGFGHNDQKEDDSKGTVYYTNPNLATTDSSTTSGKSFKYTLYENYVKLAEDKGATPILCTPIVRQNSNGDYDGASAHITTDKTKNGKTYKGGDYPKAIRELANEKSIALVDLTAITKQIYLDDNTGALKYHAYRTYKLDTDGTTKIPDNPDTTHLNEFGAKMVAYQFAQALKNTDCALKAQVKSLATKPTYDKDFKDKYNANYVKPTASTFDPSKASTIWTGVAEQNWYGTVFGDVGGADKIKTDNFTITGSGGTFVLDCKGSGKFSSSTDGMAAIFMPIDASKDFTAQVSATVNNAANIDKQTSFGLMLRDDIYIDTYDASIKSNYVSAGILNGGAVFAMKGETRSATNGSALIAAQNYTLKIEKSGSSITATVIQGNNTVTKTYTDISLTDSDSTNVYLCMYAVRNIKVTFNNVNVSVSA